MRVLFHFQISCSHSYDLKKKKTTLVFHIAIILIPANCHSKQREWTDFMLRTISRSQYLTKHESTYLSLLYFFSYLICRISDTGLKFMIGCKDIVLNMRAFE